MSVRFSVVAAVIVSIVACSSPTRDALAPTGPRLDDNTNTDVRLTITYSGPTFAYYGSMPTFTGTATLNGSPVPNVLLLFEVYSLVDNTDLANCDALTDANGVATCQFYPLLVDPTYSTALDVLVAGGKDFSGHQYAGDLLRQEFALFPAQTVTTYTGPTTFQSASDATVTLSSNTSWNGCTASIDCGPLPVNPNTVVQLEMDDNEGDGIAFCQTTTDQRGNAQCSASGVFLSPGPIVLIARYAPFGGARYFQASTAQVGGVIVQSMPQTIEDCLNGGWMKYGKFKNQGDCVSWVATKGKNAPTIAP